MSTAATQWKHLERDPKSNYRQLSVRGRRIKARTLYGAFMSAEEPMTVEEIAASWDLPIEVVREAIAYCETKPPEIDEDWRREEALMEASGMNEPGYKHHGKPRLLSAQELAKILRR